MNAQLSILILALSPMLVSAQSEVHPSPDQTLRAVVIPVGKKGFEQRESRLEIQLANGVSLQRKNLSSPDGAHGASIAHAAWTADGQFFVFNVESSGGHQPWHLTTYFYSRHENRFHRLDDFIGPVTSDFTLTGQSTLKTTRSNFSINQEKEPVVVRLSKLRR